MGKKKATPKEVKPVVLKQSKLDIKIQNIESMLTFVKEDTEKLKSISYGDKKEIDKNIIYNEGKLVTLNAVLKELRN